MKENERLTSAAKSDRLISMGSSEKNTLNTTLSSVEVSTPLNQKKMPLELTQQVTCDMFNETSKGSGANIRFSEPTSLGGAEGQSSQSFKKSPSKPTVQKNMNGQESSDLSNSIKRVEHAEEFLSTDDSSVKIVGSWLLRFISSHNAVHDSTEADCVKTLLCVTQDKMYAYGFYGRIELKENLELTRAVRKRRAKTRKDIYCRKRRNTTLDFHPCTSTGTVPFSFATWSLDDVKYGFESDDLLRNQMQSSAVLSTDEKQMFSRYASSNGKLRKECADPYQFLTSKVLELRCSMEEKFAAGLRCEGVNTTLYATYDCFINRMEDVLRLIHIMHRGASVESQVKALKIIFTIFTNIIENPTVSKYMKISLTSATWTNDIAPVFRLFQFIEWFNMKGFEMNTECSLLCFKSSEINLAVKARDAVGVFLRAYDAHSGNTNEARHKMSKFLSLLRIVTGFSDSEVGSQGAVSATNCIDDVSWEVVKDNIRLVVLESVCFLQSENSSNSITINPPLLSPSKSEKLLLLRELARELTLFQVEELFSVVDLERFNYLQSCTNSTLGHNNSSEDRAKRQVAERHRESFNHPDDSRPKIHSEAQLVATRLIADIAFCMEQIALLEEEQGIVRKDRLEARRLLDKFNGDADIHYLHVLKEGWAEKLETVKEKYGKHFTYL